MKVLVTGRSGSGKSAVCRELQRRGRPAYGADKISGLASWVDAKTRRPVEVDHDKPINKSETLWYWDDAVLRELLAAREEILLCGSADNDLECFGLFDKVFVLTLQPETQRRRIIARTEHDYGKQPEMQERILEKQRVFVRDSLVAGGVAIDADREPSTVADEVERLCRVR